MKIEKQCCSLEQARRLRELGITAEAQWIFVYDGLESQNLVIESRKDYFSGYGGDAYSLAELGAMLPTYGYYIYPGYECKMSIIQFDFKGSVVPLYETVPDFRLETEAQARAAMLIYLLENNLTTAEAANTRLND